MKSISCRILLSCIVVAGLYAQPLLITVELGDQEALRLWESLDIPTYDFIKDVAIAEIDDGQLPVLLTHGFEVRIIDETPWDKRYVVVDISDYETLKPGDRIWSKENIGLYEIDPEQLHEFYVHQTRFRSLRRVPLSNRFWQQMVIKHIPLRSLRWDPFIQSLVDQVSTDSLTSYIQRLQDFKTRLTLTDSSYAASEWLFQKLNSWGYVPEFDSFYLDSSFYGGWPNIGYERNVLARTDGSVDPAQVIVSGHFDAVVWWDTNLARYNAPGADDNASGTAATLEAARIFRNHTWNPTIVFACWAAEELPPYRIGSDVYAQRAESLGTNIKGVINLDMIGYVDDEFHDCYAIRYRFATFSQWLVDLFISAAELYEPTLTTFGITTNWGSDEYSFVVRGFPAIGCMEDPVAVTNPHYHDTTDLLINLTPELYAKITRVAVAAMAILGIYPSMVADVTAHDVGNGNSLEMTWTANTEPDVIGYRIYFGLQSGIYTDSQFIAGANTSVDTIDGLMTDSLYYITMRALNADSNLSYMATEVTGRPRLVPLAPSGVIATPVSSGLRIDWLPNSELDLAGYRLYRRLNDDPTYDSLNTTLLTDTTYTDYPLSGANRYYYALRAFDQSGYYSNLSAEAYGRPITLDQGILVIDETRNSTNPPDTLQDAFYRYILADYQYDEHDYGLIEQAPVLSDFVPYSSVLWHADDYLENFASAHISDFQTYLDLGGNIWFVGWRPTANLEGQAVYPFDFSTGDFMYDYFKTAHVEMTAPSDSFQAADGLLGYPRLEVDSAKVPYAFWGGVLRNLEALTSATSAEDIYTMDMRNNTSPFEDAVCGLRYLGGDYKVVLFGFPLYFMDQDDARLVAIQVMSDFGEVGVAETPQSIDAVSGVLLHQNLPNPFTDQTVISYQLGHAANVRLKVYNIAGQSVKTLVDARQESGVYDIVWSGLDDRGRRVASGIYFCRLETEDHSAIKKITILR